MNFDGYFFDIEYTKHSGYKDFIQNMYREYEKFGTRKDKKYIIHLLNVEISYLKVLLSDPLYPEGMKKWIKTYISHIELFIVILNLS